LVSVAERSEKDFSDEVDPSPKQRDSGMIAHIVSFGKQSSSYSFRHQGSSYLNMPPTNKELGEGKNMSQFSKPHFESKKHNAGGGGGGGGG